jgi:hypothetical protein
MFQQVAQSLGVGLAAIIVHYTLEWRHSTVLTAADIAPAFLFVALISLVALFFYVRLDPNAGAEMSGRR